MSKVLVAIDGSENAMKAVEFAGRQLARAEEFQITLLHVLPYVPAPFWDDGHILGSDEKNAREQVIKKWLDNQRLLMGPLLTDAVSRLTALGIAPQQVAVKTISDSTDAAGSIIEEAKSGGYRIVVLGRCGHSKARHFPVGSVVNQVIGRGTGLQICIID